MDNLEDCISRKFTSSYHESARATSRFRARSFCELLEFDEEEEGAWADVVIEGSKLVARESREVIKLDAILHGTNM